jgi:hypothetical protein
VLVLVGALGLGAWQQVGGQGVQHPHAEAIDRSLDLAEEGADARPLLLLIGDSRLHHAIPPPAVLERAWGTSSPRIARITAAGLSLKNLAPARDRVLGLDPDWVVIQSEALVPSGRERGSSFARLRRRLLAPRIGGPERTKVHLDKVQTRWAEPEPAPNDAAIAASRDWLASLSDTPVLVLEFPRSPTELTLVAPDWGPSQRRRAEALLSAPDHRYAVVVIPGLRDDAFHDYVHLSEAGRALALKPSLAVLRDLAR